MKITADGLLGSAQKINNKRKLEESALKDGKSEVKSDSVSISNKISSRVETISREISQLQTSLTENQIVREGISTIQNGNLTEDAVSDLFEKTTFNDKEILRDFLEGKSDPETVQSKMTDVEKMINSDINEIRKVQVEVDNFIASNLAGNRFDELLTDTNNLIGSGGTDFNSISNLNAEKVMKLVR